MREPSTTPAKLAIAQRISSIWSKRSRCPKCVCPPLCVAWPRTSKVSEKYPCAANDCALPFREALLPPIPCTSTSIGQPQAPGAALGRRTSARVVAPSENVTS